MKKKWIAALSCLLFIGVGISGCARGAESVPTQPTQPQPIPTEAVTQGEKVSASYGYANMSLVIPDGWEYEITEYSPETGNFGVVFRPEGEQVGSLSLLYFDGWGVCGTEMETKMEFIGSREVEIGTNVGQNYWNFIKLQYMPGDYVFLNTGADVWYAQYEKEIEEILNSAVVAEGIMSYTEAEEIALSWAAELESGVYEVAGTGFYADSGVWEIFLGAINNTGPDRQIHITPDGSVKEVVLPQE